MRSLPPSAPVIPDAECLKGSRLVEAIKHFIKSAFRLRRFFTPHFWKLRAHRPAVASAMQNLLPAPYDPYAIELELRAKVQPSGHNTSALEDDSWTPVLGKLSAKALDRRFASVGAIELGAWAAEDVHSAFASIDHAVIAPIAHRTAARLIHFPTSASVWRRTRLLNAYKQLLHFPTWIRQVQLCTPWSDPSARKQSCGTSRKRVSTPIWHLILTLRAGTLLCGTIPQTSRHGAM